MATSKHGGGGGGANGTRITFYGFASFVGNIRAVQAIEWWPDDPNNLAFSTAALIPTDLSKTPTAARNNLCSIREIQCDDHTVDGGLTSVGPRFPQGTAVGGMWLSETYWSNLGAKQPRHPSTKDGRAYELTSLVYIDGPFSGNRYYGFHAKIVSERPPLTEVDLWHMGRSLVPNEQPFGRHWLDLAQDAHPIEPGATQIGGGQMEGALFLHEATAKKVGARFPKIPFWMGADFL